MSKKARSSKRNFKVAQDKRYLVKRTSRTIDAYVSELFDLSVTKEFIGNGDLDRGIRFAGKYNVLTFSDKYIENQRKFAD